MAVFEYVEASREGDYIRKGTIVAPNKDIAAVRLIKSGIKVINITELNDKDVKVYGRIRNLTRLRNAMATEPYERSKILLKANERLKWWVLPVIGIAVTLGVGALLYLVFA